jgi:hypothetical protein
MTHDPLPLARRTLGSLPPEVVQAGNVYLDRRFFRAGDHVPVGRETTIAPEPSILMFVDLEPGANWGHRCKYLLVGADNGEVRAIEGRFPPDREHLRLLHRAEGAEDWTLLTREDAEG